MDVGMHQLRNNIRWILLLLSEADNIIWEEDIVQKCFRTFDYLASMGNNGITRSLDRFIYNTQRIPEGYQ